MARKQRDEGGGDSWLNTYADLVTLLFTFFVMLFSMSSITEDKWQELVKAFANHAGNETDQVVLTPEGDGESIGANQGDITAETSTDTGDAEVANDLPIDFEELYQFLKAYIEKNKMEDLVSVNKGKDSIQIRFQNSVFFNPDSSVMKSGGTEILDFLGKCLISVENQIRFIKIDGHSANIPNYAVSDRKISSARSAEVAVYLEDMGLERMKIIPQGLGNNVPIGDNKTAEGREKNRRVEMTIISNDKQMVNPQEVYDLLNGTYDTEKYPEPVGGEEVLIPAELEKLLEEAVGTAPEPEAAPETPAPEATTPEAAPETPTPEATPPAT